ncbi:MAG: hypothetical protein HY812_12620 [Planctomycetes bacterium]|nr:hypothetical protein [Planctomycetota bacterium]
MTHGARRNRLERLLEIRRYEEAARRLDYGRALRAEDEALAGERAGRGRLAAAQGELRAAAATGRLAVEELRRLGADAEDLEGLLLRLVERRRTEGERRKAAERIFREARGRSRSLELLEERRREAEALDLRRKEQKDTDEVALRRFLDAAERRANERQQPVEEERDE